MEKKKADPARRHFLMALLFVMVCAGTCFASSVNAHAKVRKVKSAKDWAKISSYNGGTFKVTKNIKLSKSQYLTIYKNKKYTIDLNGHSVSTTYRGKELRSVCPLVVQKGTVILKSSKKKGVLYSTETAAVTVGNKAKFYLKSGSVVNDAVEFRSNMPTGLYLQDKAKAYVEGKSSVRSIGNAVTMFNQASLTVNGTPSFRAGASNLTGAFTHYGSGVNITSPQCRLVLHGGSFGTKASPPAVATTITGSYEFQQSGDFPIYDKNGKTLKIGSGYVAVDARKNNVPITSSFDTFGPNAAYFLALSGASADKRLTTTVKSPDGFYTVFILPK